MSIPGNSTYHLLPGYCLCRQRETNGGHHQAWDGAPPHPCSLAEECAAPRRGLALYNPRFAAPARLLKLTGAVMTRQSGRSRGHVSCLSHYAWKGCPALQSARLQQRWGQRRQTAESIKPCPFPRGFADLLPYAQRILHPLIHNCGHQQDVLVLGLGGRVFPVARMYDV